MNINIRSIILIGIALAMAGLTAILARSLIQTPQQDGETIVVSQVVAATTQVLVAAQDFPTGTFLKAEDLVWQSWPDDTVNENYIRKDGEVQMDSFVGSVVKSSLNAGEPISLKRIVKPGNQGFMAAVLTPGKRAVSIRTTLVTGVAGFIFPGDAVDILLTHKIVSTGTGRKTMQVSETVLKAVRVLAIDQSAAANPTHTPSVSKSVTLEVSPKDAEKIVLAKSMGDLSLSLRSLTTLSEAQTASSEEPSITWDSEVSKTLTSGGPGKGGNMQVDVFRGQSSKKVNISNVQNNKAQAATDNQDLEE